MKRIRVYVDTSVIGGCHDPEFEESSRSLIAMAAEGKAVLLISTHLLDELRQAPVKVQDVLRTLPAEGVETLEVDGESRRLCDEYMKAKVVGEASAADALHVTMATVHRADMIVSWNFKHLVHFVKMRGFNAVNLREG